MTKPTTRIGTPLPDNTRFLMRGKEVLSEIMGKMTFTETFFFDGSRDYATRSGLTAGRECRADGHPSPSCGRFAVGG